MAGVVYHFQQHIGVDWYFWAAGVDAFFVISGFIIWKTTERVTDDPVTWWKARFWRIVPAWRASPRGLSSQSSFPPRSSVGRERRIWLAVCAPCGRRRITRKSRALHILVESVGGRVLLCIPITFDHRLSSHRIGRGFAHRRSGSFCNARGFSHLWSALACIRR